MPDPNGPKPAESSSASADADLAERTRRSLLDLQQAIATLREMDLGDVEPDFRFDPSWSEAGA